MPSAGGQVPTHTLAPASASAGVTATATATAPTSPAAPPSGVLWGVNPTMPSWWPLDERWWLPGGWSVGSSLILSGVLAAGFIVYSIRRFRPQH